MKLFLFLSALILGYVGGYIFFKHGERWGFNDVPNERSSHTAPIPKAGGIGLVVSMIISASLLRLPWIFVFTALILAVLSLYSDKYQISLGLRLVGQFICAAAVCVIVFAVKQDIEGTLVYVILLILAMIFIVGTANYYNFMDGINGLAVGAGMIAFLLLGIFSLMVKKEISWGTYAISISVACIGFLPLNFPRARVFMGDVGSILLGFVFAIIVLWNSDSIRDIIVQSAFILPFYADEINTLVMRMVNKERIGDAHRRHVYQLLANQAQIPHVYVASIYWLFQIGIGAASLLLRKKSTYLVGMIVIVLIVFNVFSMIIRYRLEKDILNVSA